MKVINSIAPSADVVFRDIGGESFLLHLGTGTYFGLNAVGSRIWNLIESGATSITDIVVAIEREFDAPPHQIHSDIMALIETLNDNNLIDSI